MKNVFFPDEVITKEDVFYVCSLIERIARRLKQPNRYVVNCMGKQALAEKLSLANVMHSENQQAVVEHLIDEFRLQEGNYDVTNVNPALVDHIPTEQDMGKVYMRLVLSTLYSWEDYADAILCVYNDKICRTIDNYNGSAYYEPSYYLTRCYYSGTFN